jgi:tetratricopeptide (TPR) repeat protein
MPLRPKTWLQHNLPNLQPLPQRSTHQPNDCFLGEWTESAKFGPRMFGGLFLVNRFNFMRTLTLLLSFFSLLTLHSCDGMKQGSPNETSIQESQADSIAQLDSLLRSLNQRIIDNPNDYTAYLDRARYWGDRSMYPFAYKDVLRAIAIDSTRSDIYLLRGELYFKQEKVKEAYDDFSTCVRYDSVNVQGLLKKTGIDIVLGNYDIARMQLNSALRVNEFEPEAYYLRGRLYKTLGDTNLAASSYKTAIEVDPNYYDAYIEVGLLYAARKSDLAKEYYSSAIGIRPSSIEAWYDKAMYLQETGFRKKERYKEAFVCYDEILKIDPKFVAAHFNKGFVFLEYLQQYDSAAHYFSNAVSIFPGYYQAFYNRGLCNESLNKRKEAEADYRKALNLKPDYTEAAIALNRITSK